MSDEAEKTAEQKPDAIDLPHRMTIDEPTGITIRGVGEGEPFDILGDLEKLANGEIEAE